MALTVSYCGGCRKCCCNQFHGIRPVLLPWENEKDFFGLTDHVGRLIVLKQRADGDCIFFKAGRCSIYERRPFECQIYPFIFDFSKGEVKLILDPNANCAKFVLEVEGRELLHFHADKQIPHPWAVAHSHYTAVRREKRKEKK
jgi:Fe-S-cluster containining protein